MGDTTKQNALITEVFDQVRENIRIIREDAELHKKDNLFSFLILMFNAESRRGGVFNFSSPKLCFSAF